MADQTLDQLPEETDANDADVLYIRRDGMDRRIKRAAVVSGRVPSSRLITTGTGLIGGGDLQSDITLGLNFGALSEDLAPSTTADYAITFDGSDSQPKRVRLDRLPGGGSGGTTTNAFANIQVGQTTVSADSPADTLSLVAGSNINLAPDAAGDAITISATNIVPTSRVISAGAGLTGGGALTGDRTLAVSIASQSEDIEPDFNNDYVLTHDTSAGTLRKVRLSLLGGTSYVPQIASPATLGVIRIGPGLSIDSNGIVSAATSYTLPAATTTTRGGVTVGTGLTIDAGGVLRNANPTPYVPTVATVGTAGVVKPGASLTVAVDGTLDVVGQTGGGGVSDGAYRPETYGTIRGTGLSLSQRQANTAAINRCWADASATKGRVDMGSGTFEIYGPLAIVAGGFTIGGDRCVIRQYQSGVNVVAASSVSQITVRGVTLTYATAQTTGTNPTTLESYAAALRLSAVSDSHFEDIETSGAWVGIGVSASTGSYNNTFMHIKIAMSAGLGYGLVHKAGTGSAFVNFRVTGNGLPVAVGGGVYLDSLAQTHFTQLTVEDLTCARPLQMVACPTLTFSGSVFNNLTPTTSNGYAGLIYGLNGTDAQFAGSLVSNTRLNGTGQGVTDAAVYVGEQGFACMATNVFLTNTVKTGTVRFALLGHTSSSAALNLAGTFQQIRLDVRPDTPHRIDDLCYATVDPLSESIDGPLLAFNNSVGAATGGFATYTPDLSIYYPAAHGRHIRIVDPLTDNIAITLSQYIDESYANTALNAPRVYRGAIVRVERAPTATGPYLVTVNGHTGTGLTTLVAGAIADFVFDRGAWALMAGQGAGGGAAGTFATQAEAQAGVSTTTYMSPARTSDAINAYASANEINGTEGQVLGFDATGDAIPVKNTRAIVIPVVAETTAVAVGTGLRNIRMPIGLKLSAVELYLTASGTTATTADVNLNGTSIFTSPPTLAANGTFVSQAVFTTATLPKGGVVTVDVDVAGSPSKGLQVTLIGIEV